MSETSVSGKLAREVEYSDVFNEANYRSFAFTEEEAQDLSDDVAYVIKDKDNRTERVDLDNSRSQEKREGYISDRASFQAQLEANLQRISDPATPAKQVAELEHKNHNLRYQIGQIDRRLAVREQGYNFLRALMRGKMMREEKEALELGMRDYLTNYVAAGKIGPCSVSFLGEVYEYSE
ncbi:hypothetical protein FUAX_27470 [Fulvitalea axinellae]|uniref:Uncharacterized protein n=1 Tax=Fulvitalea axinellae TaxID=1182444 RepID=A0AAU9DGY7_9BACT|nr:hypothetical protein FUAX_27470 [Fulvitalea axinellae]